MNPAKSIALVGAGGAIGRSVIAALRKQGRSYRAIGRTRSSLDALIANDGLGQAVTWNPDDPASVREALRGSDAIIYLVGVDYWDFARHPVLMQATLDSAIAEGVERILLVGTVYPFGRPQTARVAECHSREPHTFKGRMRKAQEDALFAAHRAGKILATELRLPDFYGPGVEKSFLHGAFESIATGKRAPMIGPIATPHEYVFVPDVGPAALALLDEPRAFGRDWNFGGAGVTSQRDLIRLAERIAGRKAKTLVAGELLLRAMAPFDKFMRELIEMHYLQTTPVILNDDDLLALLPNLRKTPYEAGVGTIVESFTSARKQAA